MIIRTNLYFIVLKPVAPFLTLITCIYQYRQDIQISNDSKGNINDEVISKSFEYDTEMQEWIRIPGKGFFWYCETANFDRMKLWDQLV